MTVLLCAVLSGVMFYLSQGLDNVWSLAWIAPVPLLWLAYGAAPRWQVLAASFVAFAAGQIYMVQAYGGILPVMVVALSMLGPGALFAFAIVRARTVQRKLPPLVTLVAFPVFWTSIEYLYSLVSPGGSFGSLAYSQVSYPATIQIVSVFGLYAVTFTLCLFANALALAARGARSAGAIGIGFCALVLAVGYFSLAAPQGATVQVAALSDWEGRLRAVRKLDPSATFAMAQAYAKAAREQAGRGARLIVISETALAASPAWRDAALAPLAAVARDKQATIVAGVMLANPWRNVALTFLPDGTVHEYDKRHLLLPLERRYRPGQAPGILDGGKAVAICKDLDFPRTLRADARSAAGQGGIRLMAVPANDFVKDDWLHARMAVVRGVENGFAQVRSAFNGLETVSDAQGRIIASANTSRAGMVSIEAKVALGPGPTLYTRIGDVFAWLCVAAALGLAAWVFRKQP